VPKDRETDARVRLPVEGAIYRTLEISANDRQAPCRCSTKRWRRRAIGVVSGSSNYTAQPCCIGGFISPGRCPFADVRLEIVARTAGDHEISRPEAPMSYLPMSVRCRGIRERSMSGSTRRGCWCASPDASGEGRWTIWMPGSWPRRRSLGGKASPGKSRSISPPSQPTCLRRFAVPREHHHKPDQVLADGRGAGTKSWRRGEKWTTLVTGERRGKGL